MISLLRPSSSQFSLGFRVEPHPFDSPSEEMDHAALAKSRQCEGWWRTIGEPMPHPTAVRSRRDWSAWRV